MRRDDVLFYKNGDFRQLLESMKTGLRDEIDHLSHDKILQVSEEDLYEYLVNIYTLEAPILHDENKYAHPAQDTQIDVSGRFDYITDGDGHHYVKGTSVTIAVPFEGDGQLFDFNPSVIFGSAIRGEIAGNEILLTYRDVQLTPDTIKKENERDIQMIKQRLADITNMINQHNTFIKTQTRGFISERKNKVLRDQNTVASLGIPIKRREDAPATYVTPSIRRKPKIEQPKVKGGAFKPEPVLEMVEYENILTIIYNMARVMESSPKAFVGMEEEDLRMHFLVQLNGQYEGQATGETFNYEGKTDILIRYEGRNVFIAECKFWDGEKSLSDTIDQLLSYTSWRDTKTAIILFNKNKNFTAVLSKIPEVVKAHGFFKRDIGKQSETSFRYIFHQKDDINRELILTVMAFDVPK